MRIQASFSSYIVPVYINKLDATHVNLTGRSLTAPKRQLTNETKKGAAILAREVVVCSYVGMYGRICSGVIICYSS